MFSQELSLAGHTRRFIFTATPTAGWEMRVEEDDRVLRRSQFSDWHRVERALAATEREVRSLVAIGWQPGGAALSVDQPTKR